ncbi:MAG: choice-of-anchor Q domain-containing protein, partial [Anaerolineae bacterium]
GSGDDTIDLTGVTGMINLTDSLPPITSNIVFNGPGESSLTVRRHIGGNYRIFTVGTGAMVTISGLTISDGLISSDGGGIYNEGTLTLTNSTVSNNDTNTTVASSGHGGGIYNAITGTLTLTNSTISNNTILNAAHDGYGGGIYSAGTLTLSNSTVSNNNTYGDYCHGGGIHNEGTLTLNNSTVSGNNAGTDIYYGDGGGIHNVGGSVGLNNSTISSNSSNGGGSGGGLWNSDGASMELTNSTLSFNVSYNDGGGIYNTTNSTLTLNNSTIGSFNYAFGGNGGGVWNDGDGTVNLKNSIIARNGSNSAGPDCYNTAVLTSLDYNLVGDDSDCSFTPQTNDQVNVNPLLGELQDNGGPTETRALRLGSPAFDAIPTGNCTDHQGTPITTDQRGVPRPQGAACDIGAYEAQVTDPSLIKTVDEASPSVGETVVFTVQATNNGPLEATGVVISDSLPFGLTFVSSSTSQGSYTSGTGEWNVGGLMVGLSTTLTISATVDAGAANTTITNTATITASDQIDPDVTNNTYVVVVNVPGLRCLYLPLIVRNHTPPVTFPLHIGDAIPVRKVAYQGEVFYTTAVQMPDELPSGGHFYFSSQRDTVAKVLVDDALAVLLNGAEVFTYDFSTGGLPEPVIVEVPRTTMEQMAGWTVTIEYRDVYASVVEASAMWLIWTP